MGSLGAYERIKTLGRGASGTVSLMVRHTDSYAMAIKHIGGLTLVLFGPHFLVYPYPDEFFHDGCDNNTVGKRLFTVLNPRPLGRP